MWLNEVVPQKASFEAVDDTVAATKRGNQPSATEVKTCRTDKERNLAIGRSSLTHPVPHVACIGYFKSLCKLWTMLSRSLDHKEHGAGKRHAYHQ